INSQNSDYNDDVIQPNLTGSSQDLDSDILLNKYSLPNLAGSSQELDNNISLDEDSLLNSVNFLQDLDDNILLNEDSFTIDSSGDDEEFQSVDEESSSDELLLNDNKLFVTPEYLEESDTENTSTNINMNNFWILLWILKYQERFRLLDITVNSLIKFFRVVLSDANEK
ncbi:14203_t:CDS:2, partial [Funneliformis caledonium]